MRLNFDILQDYLRETYPARRFGSVDKNTSFGRPMLYESGTELKTGGLYVTRDDMLPRTPPPSGTGFICVGERLPQWNTRDVEVLCVSGESGILPLFNQIQSIYDRLDAWDEQLRNELEKDMDFDIGQILVLGAGILENPVEVVGQYLQPLFSTQYEPDSSGAFPLISDATPIDTDYAEMVKKVCRLERMITVPYLSTISVPSMQAYCNNLYPFGQFMGCVSVCSMHRPFRERDFPLADHFFGYFQKAFLKYLRVSVPEESPGAAALGHLLNQEPLSARERELLHLPTEEYWYCIQLKEKPGEETMPLEYMYGTLSALMRRTVFLTLYHGEIIGLIRVGRDGESALESLEEIVSRMGYVCGLSNRFTDIRLFHDDLLPAGYAVDNLTGQRVTITTLNFFRDQVLQYRLRECTG